VFVLRPLLFPQSGRRPDPLHMRAAPSLRIEEKLALADQINQPFRQIIPQNRTGNRPGHIACLTAELTSGTATDAGTSATSDAKSGCNSRLNAARYRRYVNQLRRGPLAEVPPGRAVFSFSPRIVTQFLNFGTSLPRSMSPSRANHRPLRRCTKTGVSMRHIPGAVDVPSIKPSMLRTSLYGQSTAPAFSRGMQPRCRRRTSWSPLSPSFQTAPAFWLDPKRHYYNICRADPALPHRLLSVPQNTLSQRQYPGATPQILQNLVTTTASARPALIFAYDAQPMINVLRFG